MSSSAPVPQRARVRGTQRRGDERRQRLLRAAHSLIARRPLSDVTYAAVCAEAGVPPSSAHHFYPDLDAIFRALLETHRVGFDSALTRPLRPRERRTWKAVVECLIDRAVRYHRAHPIEAKLAIGGQTPPHLKRVDRDADRALAKLLLGILEELFVVPRLEDREVLAYITTQIVDVALTMSMGEFGRVTPGYVKYAKAGAVGFLSQFFGDHLEPRPATPPAE